MKFQDLIKLYEKKKEQYGKDAFRHISELLREAKEIHRRDWLRAPTPNNDHEQYWRAFKGKNLEKLVIYIIKNEVGSLGLRIVEGNTLERTNSSNLTEELNRVKRNLLIDYGEFGSHLPDVDIIIYSPQNYEITAVILAKLLYEKELLRPVIGKLN